MNAQCEPMSLVEENEPRASSWSCNASHSIIRRFAKMSDVMGDAGAGDGGATKGTKEAL